MNLLPLILFLGLRPPGALSQPVAVPQTPPSGHYMALTWTGSPDAPSPLPAGAGYNLYRISAAPPCPAPSSSYVKITATPISGLSDFDTAVVAGNSYCYYLTFVLSGLESPPGNTAGGTIPLFPPAGLGASGH